MASGQLNPELPKSLPDTDPSLLCFMNITLRSVSIFWVDYSQRAVYYKTLKPFTGLNVNTFVGHPWIAFDSTSYDQLKLESKYVFYTPAMNGEERLRVPISLPRFTLRQRAMQVVRDNLKDSVDVEQLFLPASVAKEVVQMMQATMWAKSNWPPGLPNIPLQDLTVHNIFNHVR